MVLVDQPVAACPGEEWCTDMASVEQGIVSTGSTRAAGMSFSILSTKTRLFVVDLVTATSSAGVAAAVVDPGRDGLLALVGMLVAWWFWLARARLYSSRFITRRADEVRRIVDASVRTAATVAVVAYAASLDVTRGWLAVAAVTGATAITIEREIARAGFDRRRRRGELSRRVVMVGENEEARQLRSMFEAEPQLGYEIVATVDPRAITDRNELTTRVLAEARTHDALGAVVAASGIETKASNRLVRDLIENGIHVELSSTLSDIDSDPPDRAATRPLPRRLCRAGATPRLAGDGEAGVRREHRAGRTRCRAPVLAVLAVAIRRSRRWPGALPSEPRGPQRYCRSRS